MSENHPSEILSSEMREIEESKKEELIQALARTSARLLEIGEMQEQLPPISFVARSTNTYLYDEGWVMSSRPNRREIDFLVTASDLSVAYLGILARQPDQIRRVIANESNDQGSVIEMQSVHVFNTAIRPPRSLLGAFSDARISARALVMQLREEVKEKNPYTDLPIKIDEESLIDAMLRRTLLDYCQNADPHFSITEVKT